VPTGLTGRLVVGSHEVGILVEDVDQTTGGGSGEAESWQAGSFYHSLGYQSRLILGESALFRELGKTFDLLQPVVNDGTEGCTVGHLPHLRFQRPGAAQQVWKTFAVGGTALVDRTVVAAEEDAAGFVGALEDGLAFVILHYVLGEEAFAGCPEQLHQMLYVALGEFHFGDLAALRAGPAVDSVMDFLRGLVELAFDEGVRFKPAPEAHVLGVLLFAFAFDLDEIGDQLPE
jgi:hypothetical protein